MTEEIKPTILGDKTHALNFTKKEAALFLEMTTGSAVKGPDAATLASLHAMALDACEALK